MGHPPRVPALAMNLTWTAILTAALFVTATLCAWALWSKTRFD